MFQISIYESNDLGLLQSSGISIFNSHQREEDLTRNTTNGLKYTGK